MDKKEIKHIRTRGVFAEAAAEMIREEGVESLSVRKVAEKAGYSLGTVYNHFTNFDEMLWLAREKLIEEVGRYMVSGKTSLEKADDLADSFRRYIKYFTEHKEVFRFFYFHQLNNKSRNQSEQGDRPESDGEMERTCRFIEKIGGWDEQQSPVIYRTFIYSIHGLLTLYLSENDNLTEYQLESEIDSIVHLLLKDG